MTIKKDKTLTLKGLVAELHKWGFSDVTERRIKDWKEKCLLPPFDETGRGFGKGKGKAASRWKNRRSVIRQMVYVYKLRQIYHYTDELYLPLWMLGFPIPIELVRKALIKPLEFFSDMFETGAREKLEKVEPYERMDGIVEDYIGDLVLDLIEKYKIPEIFGTPPEVVEVPMNIFFNPDYEIPADNFQDGVAALSEWKEIFDKEIMPILLKGFDENPETTRQPIKPAGIEVIFDNALFFQEYLSVPQLYKFVSEAAEEDFREVQTDMQVVRAIVESLSKVPSILMEDITDYPKPSLDDFLPALFSFGNLLILADISLRRNGWSERFDLARGEIIKKIREDFSEEAEKALAEQSPAFAEAFEKGIKMLKKNFENLVAGSQDNNPSNAGAYAA